MRISPQLVTLLALALAGCNKASGEAQASSNGSPAVIIADGQGFTPNQVTLKKGGDGKLRFERKSDDTCATEVVFPDLNIKKMLPLNQVVEVIVPTTDAKTYTFTCGMGMYKSAVVVN